MTVQNDRKTKLLIVDINGNKGWWNAFPVKPIIGGVVVMAFEDKLPEELTMELKQEIIRCCVSDLRVMHARNYCHTDIRPANIMKIKGKYTLIDYGEAVEMNTRINVYTFAAGRKKLVDKRYDMDGTMEWGIMDDCLMLCRGLSLVDDAADVTEHLSFLDFL